MDKALRRISELNSERRAQAFRELLKLIGQMPKGNRVLRRIASASDKEQLEDCLAEVRYALIFAGLGFHIDVEPLGSKGPDFRISREGQEILVEVTRFRKINPGPPPIDLSEEIPMLAPYGNMPRDIRKAFDKVLAKFSQIPDEAAIIAIWNDDGDLEEIEVEMAVRDILTDAKQNILSIPHGLQFILYGSEWVGSKQLYCYPLRHPTNPLETRLQQEFEASFVSNLIRQALR